MRLGLSSAVAPGDHVLELMEGCAHRGLSTLELRWGDAHGVSDVASAQEARAAAAERGIEIVGLRVESGSPLVDSTAHGVARALDAPLILAGTAPLPHRLGEARALTEGGTPALVEVRGPHDAWLDVLEPDDAALAWTIDRSTPHPGDDLDGIRRAGVVPRYLRMAGGGGPEAAMGGGRGVGTLMARLALDRFAGPLILSPGSSSYRVAWSTWLGRRGGWGCGGSTGAHPVPIAVHRGGGRA